MRWERFTLCSLLGLQECGTGGMDLTSAAVQGDTCSVTQSINPAGGRLRPHEEIGKEKGYADVNLDRLTVSNIYVLHLTSNVCMHRVWQALGVHYY